MIQTSGPKLETKPSQATHAAEAAHPKIAKAAAIGWLDRLLSMGPLGVAGYEGKTKRPAGWKIHPVALNWGISAHLLLQPVSRFEFEVLRCQTYCVHRTPFLCTSMYVWHMLASCYKQSLCKQKINCCFVRFIYMYHCKNRKIYTYISLYIYMYMYSSMATNYVTESDQMEILAFQRYLGGSCDDDLASAAPLWAFPSAVTCISAAWP